MEILIKSSNEDLLRDLADNLKDVDYMNYILSIQTANTIDVNQENKELIIINIE